MHANYMSAQAKLSALRAGTSAGTVLLVGMAMLPLRAILDRVFDGKWGTIDWLGSVELIVIISGLWFLVLFISNLLEFHIADSRQTAATPAFPATVFIRVIYSACVGMSLLIFWVLRKQHEPVWMQCLSLSFALLAFCAWPRTITFDDVGIRQLSLLGVRRMIKYGEVEYVTYEPTEQTTSVVGATVTIKHTSCHSDPELFQSIIAERTGKEIRG